LNFLKLRKVVLTFKGNEDRPETAIFQTRRVIGVLLHLRGMAIAHPELVIATEHGVRLRRKGCALAHRPCLR
jgi:hypothetical protein